MKLLCYAIILLIAVSCNTGKGKEPFVLRSSKNISIVNDVVLYNNSLFSGALYELNPDNKDTTLLERYKDGSLNGTCRKWFPNKQLMESREYKLGRKNGTQVSYWENGNKRFEFVAKNDACEGQLQEWNMDGKLTHLANYIDGQEEGTQKLWYDNGKIRANYIIIKGKRYGLLGTKNCRNVSDSIFIVK